MAYENAIERLQQSGHQVAPASDGTETREQMLDRVIGPDATRPSNPELDDDGAWHGNRAVHSAAAELKARREAGDPRLQVEDSKVEEAPAIRHRIRGDGPLTVKEAARGLARSKEVFQDPAYRDAKITLDRLVAGGADEKEAQHDYEKILLAAEQQRARREAGLEPNPADPLRQLA